MDYSKIQGRWTLSIIFKSADPACRGVWVSLIAFCASVENGGRIVGARAWNDRQWMACCSSTKTEVDAAVSAELLNWDGDDLRVGGYDARGEEAFQGARAANKEKADKRWKDARSNAAGMPPAYKPDATGSATGITDSTARGSPGGNAPGNAHSHSQPTNQGESARAREASPPPEIEIPAHLDPLRRAGVPLERGPIAKWLDVAQGLTETDVAEIIRGSPAPTWPSEFAPLRSAWETARREALAELDRKAQQQAQRDDTKRRELASRETTKIALHRGRRVLAAIERDESLIEFADGPTRKRLALMAEASKQGRGAPLYLSQVLRDLPALVQFADGDAVTA